METVVAAAVQASPVSLDRDATVERAVTLIQKAAADGARLIVFPETFLPGYPDWVWRSRPWDDGPAAWYARLLDQSVVVPGPATQRRHIAKEGRVFVIGATFCMRGSDVPSDIPGRDELYGGDDDWLARGNSAIVGPDGELLAGPLVEEEGIVVAELDVARAQHSRRQFDPMGHYARADVFRLVVDTRARSPVVYETPEEPRQP